MKKGRVSPTVPMSLGGGNVRLLMHRMKCPSLLSSVPTSARVLSRNLSETEIAPEPPSTNNRRTNARAEPLRTCGLA